MLKACAYHKPNKRYIYDNFNSCERFKRSIFFCFAMSLIGLGSFEQGLVWLRVVFINGEHGLRVPNLGYSMRT